MSDPRPALNLRDRTSPGHRRQLWNDRPAARTPAEPARPDFDAAAWMAVLEEQKLAIARAAGVDPSKVRIQVGH